MVDKNGIYYNGFFSEWELPNSFKSNKIMTNLTQNDIWADEAKFYFLPFLANCYNFTRQHKLPYFTLMTSPTMIFTRDRLHLRMFPDTIHQVFFRALEVCDILPDETIMLLVEKRFHIQKPIDGGTQQLYNMLWDADIRPQAQKCYLPPKGSVDTSWGYTPDQFNPGLTQDDLWLSRGTLWLQDDLNFLCKRYVLDNEYHQSLDRNNNVVDRQVDGCSLYSIDTNRIGEYHSTEVLDLDGKVDDEKKSLYRPREFYFKVFQPKKYEQEQVISSDSDIIDIDDIDKFDDNIGNGMLDSTLDFEMEDREMNKIIAFFAKMPKVTGLVQGMLDIITSLTRILPLVANRLDKPEDEKLKSAIERTLGVLNLGIDKVMKICAFLGLKVDKKPSGAMAVIVKDRFKKNKKDFIEYEIDELNKAIDCLENVDSEQQIPLKGKIPPDITPNNLYPQVMDNHRPHNEPHCDPVHEFLATGQEQHQHPPKPQKSNPHKPPKKEEEEIDSSESKIEPPKIPSVKPEPPNVPPKGENGIK